MFFILRSPTTSSQTKSMNTMEEMAQLVSYGKKKSLITILKTTLQDRHFIQVKTAH